MSRTILPDRVERIISNLQKKVRELDTEARIPAGAVVRWARAIDQGANVNDNALNRPPEGWLHRNGDPVSRSTFGRLFTEIGTTHGAGDGSTTFNLPGGTRDITALGVNWRGYQNDPLLKPQLIKTADNFVLLRGLLERTPATTAYTLPATLFTLPSAGFFPERHTYLWAGATDTGGNVSQLRFILNKDNGLAVVDMEMGTNNKQPGSIIYLDGLIYKASETASPELTIIKT